MAKVKLFARHWGLIDLMYGVLKNHDVRLQEPWEDHQTHKGDEDIVISTFAYQDINNFRGSIPAIIYATDPVPLFMVDRFKSIQKEKWLTMVVSERCYPDHVQPIEKEYTEIPFALDKLKYHDYIGDINKVFVVNRKAHDRWDEVIKGVTGLGCPLTEYLEGIPFDICNIPDKGIYRQTLARYKVMFYFSNSPYTIVMWEAMATGMPMVGFNHSNATIAPPVEKYLHNYSTDRDTIRKMLQDQLSIEKPEKELYNIPDYEETVKKWDNVIEQAITNFRT